MLLKDINNLLHLVHIYAEGCKHNKKQFCENQRNQRETNTYSMTYSNYIIPLSLVATILFSCDKSNGKADGYGNFEATEITVSAENNGKLMQFDVNEGDQLTKDQFIGYIDTIPLALKREQLFISKDIISSKSKGVLSQINVLNAKLKTAQTNKTRSENLIKDNAGTQKQLDDVQGEIEVIKNQIRSVEIQNAPVVNELKSIDIQLKQIDDQIDKSKIVNPINGTVLTKYSEPGEITSFGRPLYKIANLGSMQLRVYISETQLANINIGQEVTIKIDDADTMKAYKGIISWIASEAEFTPKIIQTKEERVALVYAVKVDVTNDGSLKIGMPAELWFYNSNTN
ncbi:HlyD family secretion protein [Gelidibacter sediminis]|uniref:HlyD family secretion protein n=2 Tax=Gelidibacter sediminis TaxID=1608710 RepID=A0A4R7PZK8_9FLAO|nr:HlyD family secretion protein [Gelidibacter sediminis]